ncbi:hypothetical protein FHG87_013349, partial [Trinorchestia longiramus]
MPFGKRLVSKLRGQSLSERVAAKYGHIEVLRFSDPKLDWKSQEPWEDVMGPANRVKSKTSNHIGVMESTRLSHFGELQDVINEVTLASDAKHQFIQQILVAYFFSDCLF